MKGVRLNFPKVQSRFTQEQLDWLDEKNFENDLHFFRDTFRLAIERKSFDDLLTEGETKSLKRSGILGGRKRVKVWFTEDFLEKHKKELGVK